MNYIEPQDAISSFQREYNIQTVSSIFTCTLDSSSTIASLIALEELILVCPLCLCYLGVQSDEQRNSCYKQLSNESNHNFQRKK